MCTRELKVKCHPDRHPQLSQRGKQCLEKLFSCLGIAHAALAQKILTQEVSGWLALDDSKSIDVIAISREIIIIKMSAEKKARIACVVAITVQCPS